MRLPAIVGLGRALDLILTGRPIKGKEALEWGLANRLVACGTGKQENLHSNKVYTYMIAFMEYVHFLFCLNT